MKESSWEVLKTFQEPPTSIRPFVTLAFSNISTKDQTFYNMPEAPVGRRSRYKALIIMLQNGNHYN